MALRLHHSNLRAMQPTVVRCLCMNPCPRSGITVCVCACVCVCVCVPRAPQRNDTVLRTIVCQRERLLQSPVALLLVRNLGQYGRGAAPCPRSSITLHTSQGAGAAETSGSAIGPPQLPSALSLSSAAVRTQLSRRCIRPLQAHAALTPLHLPSSSVATQPAQSCVPHQLHTCTISTHTPCLQQHPGPPRTSVQGCSKPRPSPARQPDGTTETLRSSCGQRPNRFRTCRSSVIRGANV